MKAKIYLSDPSVPTRVVVEEDNPRFEFDDDAPERITTAYVCPPNGGYVKIDDWRRGYPQVCEGLSNRGSTLRCCDPNNLLKLIRKQHKRRLEDIRNNRV